MPKVATRPIKVAIALMDRVDLGEYLGRLVALRILNSGRLAVAMVHLNANEISTVIAELLQDLGSVRIFWELERVLVSEKESTHDDFELFSFSLSMFARKNHVVGKRHLPALLKVAVRSFYVVSADAFILDMAFGFCSKEILAMGLSSKDFDVDNALSEDIESIISGFVSFFVAWLAHVVQAAPPESRRAHTACLYRKSTQPR